LDRIDLWVPVRKESTFPNTSHIPLHGALNSQIARERVIQAREIQLKRQGCENARLVARKLQEMAALSTKAEVIWNDITRTHHLSPRGAHRLLRVARTLADLDASPVVQPDHLFIASQWRAVF
jgi:magnesium chelatase family protein